MRIVHIFLLFICLLTGVILYRNFILRPTFLEKKISFVDKKTPVDSVGVSLTSDKNTIRLGDKQTLYLVGDFLDNRVVGFDLIIKYDPAMFDIVAVDSLVPDLKLYQNRRKEGILTVTGIQRVDSKASIVVDNSRFLTLTTLSKKRGKSTIFIISEEGKQRSQLVDSSSKSIVIRPASLELAIQ